MVKNFDSLDEEIDYLQNEVDSLGRKPVDEHIAIQKIFTLSRNKAKFLQLLLRNDNVTYELGLHYVFPKTSDATVKNLYQLKATTQMALAPYKIEIHSIWQEGYYLKASDKKVINEMVENFCRGEAMIFEDQLILVVKESRDHLAAIRADL